MLVSQRASESDVSFPEKPCKSVYTCFLFLLILLKDIILYAILIPFVGTYLSGSCAKSLELASKLEVVLTVTLTLALVYAAIALLSEPAFWRQLFGSQSLHYSILRIRDWGNLIILFITLGYLAFTINGLVDGYMKPDPDGIRFFSVCINIEIRIQREWYKEDKIINLLPSWISCGNNAIFAHGGVYMFYCAALSACVAKTYEQWTYLSRMNEDKIRTTATTASMSH